jgi:hypothetical protein
LTFTHLAGVQFSSPTGAPCPAACRIAGVPPNFGGHSEGETPLPIPNRAVKPLSADGTWCSRAWESRSPPILSSPRAARRGGSSRFTAGSTGRLSGATGAAPQRHSGDRRGRRARGGPALPEAPPRATSGSAVASGAGPPRAAPRQSVRTRRGWRSRRANRLRSATARGAGCGGVDGG